MRGLHIQRPTRAGRVLVLAVAALALTVGPALANPVPTTPEPPIACEAGTGLVTRYVTTVHTPADATDWWVSVEFTIADSDEAAAACELTLATYEMASAVFSYPQSLHDSDSGTFSAGTHMLTAALPLEGNLDGCWSQYDFVFGPAIEELTFENRYGQERQIRARIVGSAECPAVVTETPTPTPTPSPSPTDGIAGGTPTPTPVVTVESPAPTPRGDVAGGNPTPTPAGGALPDTSLPGSGTPIALLTGILGLTMLGSISALALVNVRARNTRR